MHFRSQFWRARHFASRFFGQEAATSTGPVVHTVDSTGRLHVSGSTDVALVPATPAVVHSGGGGGSYPMFRPAPIIKPAPRIFDVESRGRLVIGGPRQY